MNMGLFNGAFGGGPASFIWPAKVEQTHLSDF